LGGLGLGLTSQRTEEGGHQHRGDVPESQIPLHSPSKELASLNAQEAAKQAQALELGSRSFGL
jgi:hypothetical protein